MTTTILIDAAGTPKFVWDDSLIDVAESLGEVSIVRASHVEAAPAGPGWIADMKPSGGPILLDNGKPFRLHSQAIAAERQWLAENCGL